MPQNRVNISASHPYEFANACKKNVDNLCDTECLITMKKIEIIIPHRKLEEAHEILRDVNTGGMSYYRIEGSGKIKAELVTVGRGTTQMQPEYIPRTKVEVVVKDEQVEDLISTITQRLRSDLGGKIFVVDVPIAVDIGTDSRGESAI
jgi:nitrogen regulatory protein P-II 1